MGSGTFVLQLSKEGLGQEHRVRHQLARLLGGGDAGTWVCWADADSRGLGWATGLSPLNVLRVVLIMMSEEREKRFGTSGQDGPSP